MTATRFDLVNAALLGMKKTVSEDTVRRTLARIGGVQGVEWVCAAV